MIYGHDRTIHRSGHLDVETDDNGNVVAVWFRCLSLPFKQVRTSKDGTQVIDSDDAAGMKILAVEVSEDI